MQVFNGFILSSSYINLQFIKIMIIDEMGVKNNPFKGSVREKYKGYRLNAIKKRF